MGKLVAFGGILIPSNKVLDHTAAVEAILTERGVPAGTEIKWSLPRNNWIRENLAGADREDFFRKLIQATVSHEAKAVVIVWDCGRSYCDPDTAFEKCVDFTFERVSMQLKECDSQCVFIADRPGGGRRDDNEFLANFLTRAEQGTRYVGGERVLTNVLTTNSHLVRQLQIADVIASVVTSVIAGNVTYTQSIFDEIKPMLFRNGSGTIGGTGVKLFPDDLVNLYHWVLGEHHIPRSGGATGSRIPSPHVPYFEGPGI